MFDYLYIRFYKILNWLMQPFLVMQGRKQGIEAVANQFLQLARKVSPVDGFYHSFKNMNVSYDLFNGIFFKSDTFHDGILSIVNDTTVDGTIDIHKFELKCVPEFSEFASQISNQSGMTEKWSIFYDKKNITHLLCKLIISPYKFDYTKSHHIVKIEIVFDPNFKVVSIYREHFKRINSEKSDISYFNEPSLIFVNNDISNLDLELLFIKLAVSTKDSVLGEMFPEYFNDTVCDYSSEAFQQRVDLYLMESY